MPYRQPGSPYWYISYTDASGHRVRESSGSTSLKEAKALESKRRLDTHRITKWGEQPRYTYDELMAAYLRETQSKRSHQRDLYSAANLNDHFTGRMIADLGPDDIAEYKRKRPVKEATIAKELLLLSAAIRYANSEWGWGLPNPTSGRVPQPKRKAPKWLTEAQVDALLKAATGRTRAPHLLDFIELGLSTGMRRDEMLRLEWSRVDFKQKLIYFDTHDQKSGVPGSIPLNATALAVLKRRGSNGKSKRWVFENQDGGRLQSLKHAFARACRIAQVEASPHSLRHTFASRLVQAGVPLRTVMDLCRHADIRTTMTYAHLAPENTRAAVALLDQIYTENRQSMADDGKSSLKTVKVAR